MKQRTKAPLSTGTWSRPQKFGASQMAGRRVEWADGCMRLIHIALALMIFALWPIQSWCQTPSTFVGTVTVVKSETGEFEVKPDNAAAATVKLSANSVLLRVAPGEKDLKKAESIAAADVKVGDRVLVALLPGSTEIRRLIVMSASDIAKRNEAERQDWIRRGISGIVASKKGNQIIVKVRTLQGLAEATVTVNDQTTLKRYAPDSVRFADAIVSSLSEVSAGDQLRARGQKSPDGLAVTADEVVFGTFQMRAGSVTAVNAASNEITVKELANGKPLVIKVTADSQLKRMPDFAAMMAGGGRVGPQPGGQGAAAAGAARNGGSPNGGRPMLRGDISQMLERMPAVKLDELKPGETVVVSSTKGVHNDQITAIMMVANADLLIQMAQAQSGGLSNRGMSGGLMEGFGGFDFPTMIP
ncbi:MAG: hypothetical protein PHX83_00390 [Acidobacteriia bacterium]|nr:hypothetical protein [Terriglobia bacterium]